MNRKQNDEEPESYSNDDGFTILTEQYLAEPWLLLRNGMQHCPYDYINVKEPKRSTLLQKSKDGVKAKKNKTPGDKTELVILHPVKRRVLFELVYEAVRQIPKGRVTSYGAIAVCLEQNYLHVWLVGQ